MITELPEQRDTNIDYDLFLCYRRGDAAGAAKRLWSALTAYRLPEPFVPERRQLQLRVFRDVVQNQITADLWTKNVVPALNATRRVLVLLSPALLEPDREDHPNWALRELRYLIELGREDALLFAGVTRDARLPEELRERFPNPNIVDVSAFAAGLRFTLQRGVVRGALASICGPLLGVTPGEMPLLTKVEAALAMRERIARYLVGLTAALSLVASAYFWYGAQRAEREAEDAELKPFRALLARFAPERMDLDESQDTTSAADDVLANLQIKDKYATTRLREATVRATDAAGREDRRAVLYSVVLRHTRDSRWATETLALAGKLAETPEGLEPRDTRYGAVPRLLLLLRGISATAWTEDVQREFALGLERLAVRHQSNVEMQAALLGAACSVASQRVRANDIREEAVLKWGGVDKFLEVLKRARDIFLVTLHPYPGNDDESACLRDLFGPTTVWVGTIFARQDNAAPARTDISALQSFLEALYPSGRRPIVSTDPARWRAWLAANHEYVELWSEETLETLRRSPERLNDAVAGRNWPRPGVPVFASP